LIDVMPFARPDPATKRPSAARFLVSANQPISLTQSLLLSEKIHLALVNHSNGSSVFTGCDRFRKPLKGHSHAYVFCESNKELGRGDSGEITHVTVFCSNGFGPIEIDALRRLTHIYGGDIPDVRLSLIDICQSEHLGGINLEQGQCPLLASSRCWVSRLPFLPARHPKITRAGAAKLDATGLQIDSPEHELLRLLKLSGFPKPVEIEMVECTDLGGQDGRACWTPWSSFLKRRNDPCHEKGHSRRQAGYGFRIRFPYAVQGPLALGYASHFGMGSFVAEEDQDRYPLATRRSRVSSVNAVPQQKGDMEIYLLEAKIKFLTPAFISQWSSRSFRAALGQKLQDRICAVYIPKKEDICDKPHYDNNNNNNFQELQDGHQFVPHGRHFRCKSNCELSSCCSYGQLFSLQKKSANSCDLNDQLLGLTPPLPLVVTPPKCGDFRPEEGSDCASIGLCLIGTARESLAYLILALKDLGVSGIGRNRYEGAGRFVLQSAESVTPKIRDQVYINGINGGLDREIASFSYHDFQSESEELNGLVSLQFLTPTMLGNQTGHTARPALRSLLFHLLKRANQLSSFFGTGPLYLPEECQTILKNAEEVTIKSAHANEIYSRRQLNLWKDSKDEFSCQEPPYFMGEIIYEGTFSKDIMALLTLGQIIHVGKGAEAGNGLFHVKAKG